jgi:acetyl-CoA carboxylase beta subunit
MYSLENALYLDPEQPLQAYRDFLAAVERRDVDGMLQRMSAEYASELRAMQADASFPSLFALWCDTYPESVNLVACVVAAENAIVEMEGRIDGLSFSGYAVLDRIGSTWRVSAETHSETVYAAITDRHRIALQSVGGGVRIEGKSL